MDGLFCIAFIGIIAVVVRAINEKGRDVVDNYDVRRIDNAKLTKDITASRTKRESRLVSGYYDKD